ncbi:TonB-linked outer membrane protein, SusC/RagA family [Saccharicrinis carchari]|uniref:TonB-linked outer membrane protein, SusC/RagA family n=1 Tax=Saccharicrinis carchari TaxID=1168039 RepID=A0A521D485_SACCC|nr:TonB-dependent receptor [Saccharicrinis carchari]SMO66508.1 TonB-linked outer membrane protein, SusC/RagA family [Saccharicrinis carchari]
MKKSILGAYHKFIVCAVIGMFFSINLAAQQTSISGVVTDKSGEPIPGVSIIIKGTTTGTISGIDGDFNLSGEMPADAVLVFSFIGMQTEEVNPQGQSFLQVTLFDDILGLDEVIVVGYGTQEKKDITGSVAMVNSEELESRPNTQLGSLIQGRAAGVRVVSGSGKPSEGLSVRVRGTNSVTAGSEPLYVIDGIPTSDTRSLNPADVETMTILKDASSAAIYGAQGANGVVLITTKKGKSGKSKVSLDVYGGFSEVWNTLEVLNGEQYRDLMTEMGQTTDWELYNQNTDWQNEVFKRGVSQNYQLSVSGGSEETTYYISGGWVKQEGAVRSAQMDRANFKVNLNHEVNKWLSLGTRIAYTKYSDVDVNDNNAVNQGGVLTGVINTPSVIGIYNADGTFTSNPFQNWENPIASTDGSEREYKNDRFLGSMFLKADFLKDFSFKSNLGVDYSNGIYDSFLDPYLTSYGRAKGGIANNNTNRNSYWMIENTLSYNKKVESHSLEALIGGVAQKYLWENNYITAENFSSNAITTTNAGSIITSAGNTKSEKTNTSFISRLNYSFEDKYLLTANFRADASSAFGPDNRWGYFPSFSAGWRISHESFMAGFDFLNDLKMRVGWGIVGNDQIRNYAYYGLTGSGANYPIGGQTMPGTYPAAIDNNSLKWEESEQTNIGLDLNVFNGRVQFTADAYLRKTKDLLLDAPLPHSTGYDNALQNIGNLENKGLEFSLNTVNIDRAIRWSSTFNISFNRNEVTNLVVESLPMGNIAGRGEAILLEVGQPLGTLYGYVWGGVDPATGNAYYVDRNGDSTFDPTPEDRKIIGDANPDFFYGVNNTASYKGFGLTVFLEGSYGNDMLNATRIDSEGMSDPKNQLLSVNNRWRQPGDVTDIPKASWASTVNSKISTRFIEDASYLRVKTITLSYDIPQKFLNKINLDRVKVYATGENLFTLTDYTGFDPEVNAFGGSNTMRGIDYGTYPQTRNIIFGLNVTF